MDCEAIKSSTQPYELQLRQSDGQAYPVQVFRGENLTRTQYTKAAGHVIISEMQGNFQLAYQDLAGTDVRFSYSVPTDRYVWQQAGRTVTYNTTISGTATEGPGVTQIYEMLPDEVMSVGACSFPVKRFRYKQTSAERVSDEEVWFSPDLNTNLQIVEVTTLPDGRITKRKLTAVAITTDIAPFR